jgi:hypothetical protein
MLFFFHWLREVKRVKRILKVIVEDGEQPSHSDEAIELCLEGFDVETLDWSKPDLNPDTACKASSGLSEVVLHWTGNNALLRSWSDPEIRNQLPNLSMINLIVDSVSSLDWIHLYISSVLTGMTDSGDFCANKDVHRRV